MSSEMEGISNAKQQWFEPWTIDQFGKYIALITTAAGGIAISFDIGYFDGIDINMFSLFLA